MRSMIHTSWKMKVVFDIFRGGGGGTIGRDWCFSLAFFCSYFFLLRTQLSLVTTEHNKRIMMLAGCMLRLQLSMTCSTIKNANCINKFLRPAASRFFKFSSFRSSIKSTILMLRCYIVLPRFYLFRVLP
jgi:hypothetical protein